MRNLFFWRGMEDASFKPTEGGFLFYPYGAMGRGYIVTPDQKAELGAFLRRYYLIGTIAILLMIAAMGFANYLMIEHDLVETTSGALIMALAIGAPVAAALMLYVHFGMRARLGDAPRATQRLSFSEAQTMASRTMSDLRVAILMVLGGVMAAGSAVAFYLAASAGDIAATIAAGASAVFFGLCFVMACHHARLKLAR